MSKTISSSNKLNISDKFLRNALYNKDFQRDDYYRKIEIPKRNGETRILHAVQGRMRTLQKRLNDYLSQNYKPSPFAKGFVKGGGIIENAKVHTNKKILFKYDIKDFFPNITFARVRGMFMAKPFLFSKTESTIFAQICCLDNNGPVPQGGITSPFISNMICRRLDRSLFDLVQDKFGMNYTRYADDITLSTNKYVNIDEIHDSVENIINNEGFKLNDKKTRVLKKHQRQIVTGIVVNDGMNVNRKYIRNVKSLMFNCKKYGVQNNFTKDLEFPNTCSPLSYKEIGLYRYKNPTERVKVGFGIYIFLKHIQGRLNFIKQVAESNSDEIKRERRLKIYENLDAQFQYLESIYGIKRKTSAIRNQLQEVKDRKEKSEEIIKMTKEQLDQLINEESKTDVRFFLENFDRSDINKYQNKVANLIKFRPIDLDTNLYVLKGIQGSEAKELLSKIVHDNKIIKGEVEEWKADFGTFSEQLNKGLKNRIKEFIEKGVLSYMYGVGKDEVNLWQDEKFKTSFINPFKRDTRFGKQKETSTQLRDEIILLCKNISSNKEYNLDQLKNISIYTDVRSVLEAIRSIIKSMTENTKSEKLIIMREGTHEHWELTISDDNDQPIEGIEIDRSILRGDLKSAVESLAGLCEYVIRFNSQSEGWVEIDTMSDRVTTDIEDQKGFTHLLRFKK